MYINLHIFINSCTTSSSSSSSPTMAVDSHYVAGASPSPFLCSAAEHKSDVSTTTNIYDASVLSRKRSRATMAAMDNLNPLPPPQPHFHPVTPPEMMVLRHANVEIDSLIRLHVKSLTTSLEQAQRRQCAALVAAAEGHVAKRMRALDTELAKVRGRSVELEEQLKLAAAENQMWFNAAQNNEAMACNLRAALEQAMILNTTAVAGDVEEGSGDNEEVMSSAAADGGGETNCRRRSCRRCGEKEAGVVALPCRHLCMCKDCEAQKQMQRCPICASAINATIHVLL